MDANSEPPRSRWRDRGKRHAGARHGGLLSRGIYLDAGGFAALVLDLAGTRARAMMRRPAWWVRLTRRLETGRTALITLAAHEVTGSAGSLRLGCRRIGRSFAVEVEVQRRRGGPPGGRTRLHLDRPVD